jgi:predicted secreted Zn-dependent protease
MKKIISIFILGLAMSFMTLPKVEKSINWSITKLTWADFEGKMSKSDPYDAVTSSGVSNEFSGKDFKLNFDVSAKFYPKKSKKKKNNQTAELLNHEQRHFDITEIFARKLRQSILNSTFKGLNKIGTTVNKMYSKNNSLWQKMQTKYDKETNHSKNETEQKMWDSKIDDLLESLSAYKDTQFEIDISYLK